MCFLLKLNKIILEIVFLFILQCIIILYYIQQSEAEQTFNKNKYNDDKNAEDAPKRIIELMMSYYEENHARVAALNPLRFMYEESPYYEQGYIISEILERYRKMVENTQRLFTYKADVFFDAVKRVELAQKLYFEIYHLVRMMHETPRKWQHTKEFRNTEQIKPKGKNAGQGKDKDGDDDDDDGNTGPTLEDKMALEALTDNITRLDREKEMDKKKRMKLLKELRLQQLAHLKAMGPSYKFQYKFPYKPYNTKWPIDYGWEIDTDW